MSIDYFDCNPDRYLYENDEDKEIAEEKDIDERIDQILEDKNNEN